jgi:dihydrofolate synthase / folylpolyglutamate synthase
MMKYNEAIHWLDGFQQYGMNLGLDRIQHLMGSFGHPEETFQSIHVAGTNGKGSVCRYIASVLTSEGYQVGLYVSPHLETILERFSVNNTLISETEFASIASQVKHSVDTLLEQGINPTYFEITTAMMFLWFAEKQVDYAVIEVGLGGRYDATNIITPLVSVITNVALDHTQVLGESIEKIAFEKAGIIKQKVPVVTAAEEDALTVIQQEAKNHQAPLSVLDPSLTSSCTFNDQGQVIKYKGLYKDHTVKIQNLGVYQRENVSVALRTLEILQSRGVFLSDDSIEKGMFEMMNPGRMELVSHSPFIILDGAHNPSAMKMLSTTMQHVFPKRNIIVVFGVMADKAVDDIIASLLTIADHIIVTKPNIARAMEPEEIKNHITQISNDISITLTKTVSEAVQQAVNIATNDDIILITGSLYTVGEARRTIRQQYA